LIIEVVHLIWDDFDPEETGFVDINDVYHFVMDIHEKCPKLGEFDEDKFEEMQGSLYEISDEKVSRYDLIEFIWKMNYVEPSEEE
jgi:hypothetical protein